MTLDISRHDIALKTHLNIEISLLLAALDNVTHEWRKELDNVSEENILWQPFPNGHSIGALILHMADVEMYWIQEIGDGQLRSPEDEKLLLSEETQQYDIYWPPPPKQSLAWYYAQQDRIRAQTKILVASINDPDHIGIRESEDKRSEFTLRWLLSHVMSHEAYHGGQAVLLALMQQNQDHSRL